MWKTWINNPKWNGAENLSNTLSVEQRLDNLDKTIKSIGIWKWEIKWFNYVITRNNGYKLSFYNEVLDIPVDWKILVNLAKLVQECINFKRANYYNYTFSTNKDLYNTSSDINIRLEYVGWKQINVLNWKTLEQKIWKTLSQEEVEKLVKFLNRIPEAINKKIEEALDENNK